ncbi:MAG: sigma-70 family RNA polymerase sigma factor [Crocinitomicaceae bacterium]|nr:sigma-70 family RNA polymerase sigma factor [Crocinitomicaceae bacterium]
MYKDKSSSAIIGELYTRYGHLVMGTSMKYLKNKANAEDLTMQVFEQLPKKISSHNIQRFKSWLYMVTKNECLMLLLKKGHLTTEIMKELESSNELHLKEEKEVQLNLLEQAITKLKDEQRQCIELFYLEQKSYQEIVSELKMDIKKVKSAIQNGKRNLKINLETKNEFKSAK